MGVGFVEKYALMKTPRRNKEKLWHNYTNFGSHGTIKHGNSLNVLKKIICSLCSCHVDNYWYWNKAIFIRYIYYYLFMTKAFPTLLCINVTNKQTNIAVKVLDLGLTLYYVFSCESTL